MSFMDPQGGLASLARKVWYWPVIRGVLAILLGIIALVAPLASAVALALVIGIYALVDGVVAIIDAVRHREGGGIAFRIVLGVVDILFGLSLLFWPGLSLVVLVLLAASWAVVLGILEIIASVQSRKHYTGWIWGVISGVLAVIFGIVIFAMPGVGLITLTVIVGIFAIVFGIGLIILGIQIRRTGKAAAAGTSAA